MPEGTCKACAAPLGDSDQGRVCSPCKWRNRPKIPCSLCGGPTGWPINSKKVGPAPRCRACVRANPEHGKAATYNKRGCRCAPCREAWNAECRRHQAAARRRGWRRSDREIIGATCVGCGESVRGNFKKDAPWHQACRQRAERIERRRQSARDRLAAASEGTRGWGTITSGPCGWCGTAFTVRANVPAGFCSRGCRTSERARRRGRFKIRPADRLAIYERDGWVCQLCMTPVDREAHYLDDQAPSLDHIECRSWALIPDHSPENLRLAHRLCNSFRGDESWPLNVA